MGTRSSTTELLAEWDALPEWEQTALPASEHRLTGAERRYARRVLVAMRLATDLDTCRDLLNGEPVPPETLDQQQLFIARNERLVRLDMAAIDQLEAA